MGDRTKKMQRLVREERELCCNHEKSAYSVEQSTQCCLPCLRRSLSSNDSSDSFRVTVRNRLNRRGHSNEAEAENASAFV